MDRDVALQLLTSLTAVNTAVATLVTNTAPENPAASLNMSRLGSTVDPEEEPEEEQEAVPEEEPVTRNKK